MIRKQNGYLGVVQQWFSKENTVLRMHSFILFIEMVKTFAKSSMTVNVLKNVDLGK